MAKKKAKKTSAKKSRKRAVKDLSARKGVTGGMASTRMGGKSSISSYTMGR